MRLSLFSVSYAGFWGQHQLDLPDFIAKAAELGYHGVMLAGKRPHVSPLDCTPERIASLRSTLQKQGLTCEVIAAYTDLSPGAALEVPHLELQIAYVERLAWIASELGSSVVRVFTAYEVEGVNPYAVWNGVVRALQEMCDRAAQHGVNIAVQNHHDVGVHSDAMLELLSDIDRPNCKLGFDAWSPALRGEDLYDAARKMAPHTAITTNADYVRLPRHRLNQAVINYSRIEPDLVRAVKFGEGFIDYEAFFRGLKDGGFDGIANYEMCSQVRGGGSLANLDAFAAGYVNWMQKNLLT